MAAPLHLPCLHPGDAAFSDLTLQPIAVDRFLVTTHFHYILPPELMLRHERCTVHVPAGYVSDLDTVPRWPLVYWLAKGRTVKAAVVHDWLCDTLRLAPDAPGQITRAEADRIFLDAMADEGVPGWQRRIIYAAVRAWALLKGLR
jgi:hypothetical protein